MDISRAAPNIGFRTIGGCTTFDKLDGKAVLLCAVHWEQEHFVVVYRKKTKQNSYDVYVADPGKGLLVFSQKKIATDG